MIPASALETAPHVSAFLAEHSAATGQALTLETLAKGSIVLRCPNSAVVLQWPAENQASSFALLAVRCACLSALPPDANIRLVDFSMNLQAFELRTGLRASAQITRFGRSVIALRADIVGLNASLEESEPLALVQATMLRC